MQQKIHLGVRDMGVRPYHWRLINGSFPLYEEPTILLFPGANINSPKLINGSLKIISEFINKEKPTRLMGAYYDKFDITAHKTYVQYNVGELSDLRVPIYNQDKIPAFHTYCLQFFNQYIKNIFYENERVCSISEIQNRLKNITIMTHCYGSLIAFELERLMLKEMNMLGFSADDCLRIQQGLIIVNFASRAPLGKFKSSVVHILSAADDLWLEDWKAESFYTFFQQTYLPVAKQNFYVVSDSVNGSLLSFRENEILFFIPRVNLEYGKEHRVSSYVKTGDVTQKITKNVCVLDGFLRLFINKKRQNALYSIKNHIDDWKKTPEGYIFYENGQNQMQTYQNYLKKCRIGRTILHCSVQNENIEEVNALINYWDIPLNLCDENGQFALLKAVKKQNIQIVELFLNKMDYNEIINIHYGNKNKVFFRTVLDTENDVFIKSVYDMLMQKNNRWCLLEYQPLLQEYCLKQMNAGKDITFLLPCLFDLGKKCVCMGDILKMAHFYQSVDKIKTSIGRQIRKGLLKILLTCPQKEILFEPNEQGRFLIPILKAEGVAPSFINTVICARKNYIQKLITDKLPQIINQATDSWNRRNDLSKLLCVFSAEKALKESIYLSKISDYIMLGGMKSDMAQRINKRLNKRYTNLLEQIILNESKQRINT